MAHELPKRELEMLETLLGFSQGNLYHEGGLSESLIPSVTGRLVVGMFDRCVAVPAIGCEILNKLLSFSA